MQETPPTGPGRSRPARWCLGATVVALLGACASVAPPSGAPRPAVPSGTFDRDGAPANPPPDLTQVPDAEPRIEPIRAGGPNKPYEVLGRAYVPMTVDTPVRERGLASWYGRKFHGRRTASGEPYDMYAMTAAHPTLPLPSYVRVRNPANGREVVVRVNDRGPFHPGRIIDLSYTAALKLDLLRSVAPVEIERLTFEDIRTGAWRRDAASTALAAAGSPALSAVVAPLPQPPRPGRGPAPDVAVASAAPTEPRFATAVPMLDPVGATGADLAAGRGPEPGAVAAAAAAPPPATPPAFETAPAPAPAVTGSAAPGFWLQFGAFRQREAAEGMQRRLGAQVGWIAPLLAVVDDAAMFRVHAGPYPSRADAREAALRLRDAGQAAPLVVERR